MSNNSIDRNQVKKLWWLHDSYWHATMVVSLVKKKQTSLIWKPPNDFFVNIR